MLERELFGYRVFSSPEEGGTAQEAAETKQAAFYYSMFFYALKKICGTGGVISAARSTLERAEYRPIEIYR